MTARLIQNVKGVCMTERDEDALKRAVKRMENDALREVVKDAMKELLRDAVGDGAFWLLKYLATAALGAVIIFILWVNGWVQK